MKKFIIKKEQNKNEIKQSFNEIEVVSKRNNFTKHFSKGNGLYTMEVYNSPIHFFNKQSNQFEEIDNSLVSNENISFIKNDFINLELQNELKENNQIIVFERNNHKISMSYLGKLEDDGSFIINNSKGKISKENNLVTYMTYSNVANNIDLQYCLNSSRIKENIIVHRKLKSYVFAFMISFNDLRIELNEKRERLDFLDENNIIQCSIPSPIMFDSNGQESNDICYEIEELGNGKIKFIIKASEEWINQDNVCFPVTIDPEFEIPAPDDSICTHYKVSSNIATLATKNSAAGPGQYHLIHLDLNELRHFEIQEAYLSFLPPLLIVNTPKILIKDYNDSIVDSLPEQFNFDSEKITSFESNLCPTFINYKLDFTNLLNYWINNGYKNGHLLILNASTKTYSFSLPYLRITYSIKKKTPNDYISLQNPMITSIAYTDEIGLEMTPIKSGILTTYVDEKNEKVYQQYILNSVIYVRHNVDLNNWSDWINISLHASYIDGNLYLSDEE